jgi:hypothetical protein
MCYGVGCNEQASWEKDGDTVVSYQEPPPIYPWNMEGLGTNLGDTNREEDEGAMA